LKDFEAMVTRRARSAAVEASGGGGQVDDVASGGCPQPELLIARIEFGFEVEIA